MFQSQFTNLVLSSAKNLWPLESMFFLQKTKIDNQEAYGAYAHNCLDSKEVCCLALIV